jgi:hypothetical protein
MERSRNASGRAVTLSADLDGVDIEGEELARPSQTGTSKWNKIEHRLLCHVTQTWRGRPLVDRMAVVESIAATTTKAGLKVESALDTATYEVGIKVSNGEMKMLDIQCDA